MKLPVTSTGRHRGKALELDPEAETITLLGPTGEKLGTVPWEGVIEYIQGYVEEARVGRVRNYPRSRLAVKVRYQVSANQQFETITGEIGGGGVFIESGKPLRVGTEIAMELLLPDDPTVRVHAKGKVAWVRPKLERYLLFAGMGVQFTDPRLLDFLYWVWANKLLEHQVEQLGGTGWAGPTTGVIFHWAPGSRWETHTVVPLPQAIHHFTDEHHWKDNMFKEFFENFGPVSGVSIQKRLSIEKPPTWAQFLVHIGGPDSPYYRYIFHQEMAIDSKRRVVTLLGGQGVKFEYSFERYLKEAAAVLTDCKAYQFFQFYDRYGKGFASDMGWAGQPIPR